MSALRNVVLATITSAALGTVLLHASGPQGASVRVAGAEWIEVPRAEVQKASTEVLAMPDLPVVAREDVVRIRALGLDWDVAAMVYEPQDPARIPVGADGRKVGLFILHGGSSDHRSKDGFSRYLAAKFGYKIVNMSYPGRLYLGNESHDWPGDTINADGTVRTPQWVRGQAIGPDQYEVVKDTNEERRRRWGTLILACAKEGTDFYDRMAGWPVAFEEGGRELLKRHLPEGQYSIYAHGHSTGGPFTMIFSQRIPNIAGIVGMESSPFGALYGAMTRKIQGISDPWGSDFNCLRIRSWRDSARYLGYEAVKREGVAALERLAMLMEEVFEDWEKGTHYAQFKAENMIHFDSPPALEAAARATAKRLQLGPAETQAMVDRYLGYLKELSGPDAKAVPPLLLVISNNSRDHATDVYQKVYLPMYAAMKPAPKVRVVQVEAGIHDYDSPEPGLPMGFAPLGTKLWYEAIKSGFYLTGR